MSKHVHEPLIHLSRRMSTSPKYAWTVRIVAFALSILTCAIVTSIMSPMCDMGFFFEYFFKGAFGTPQKVWTLFRDLSILLLLSLAVTPCFKMRYWNIGGEGQAMMGAFGAAVVCFELLQKTGHPDIPTAAAILIALIAAVGFGIIWAVIPALFKAKWNTNETLLTLMFNYIAIGLGAFLIKKELPSGTGIMSFSRSLEGVGSIGNNEFILMIIIAAIVTGLMAVYLYLSKHGYEVTVVGESPNTARYIGINNKLVIIRTLVLCGALCGLVGFLLVVTKEHSFLSTSTAESTIAGRGFTAVLISWLAHFNPFAMALTSFLVVFISRGSTNVGNYARLGGNYASMMVGIFFFFIIATEFFISFKISFRKKAQEIAKEPDDIDEKKGDVIPEIETIDEAVADKATEDSAGEIPVKTA